MGDSPAEAVILAGGQGTRLRGAVPDLPKPMAPVGDRPFLEFVMDYWLARGVGRFILSVGYLAEKIISHFGSGYQGSKVEYVREEEPLGTGGAVAMAFRQTSWQGENLLLINGDTWLTASPDRLARDAKGLSPPPTVVLTLVRMEKNDRYGGVSLDGKGRIARFGLPADGAPAWVNAGCCLLRIAAAKESFLALPTRFSLERDWLAPLARSGLVGASPQKADFIDIGVPEDYRRFLRDFAGGGNESM